MIRRITGIVLGVVAFFIVGGGVLYWNSLRTAERVQIEAQEQSLVQAEKVRAEASNAAKQITQQIGIPPGEIVQKYGNSTVWINFTWRLFDKETGLTWEDSAARVRAVPEWKEYRGKRGSAGKIAPKGFSRSGRFSDIIG